VRFRLYTSWGLTPGEIAKIVVFTTLTLWLGLLSIGGIIFTVRPLPLPGWVALPFHSTRPLGLLLLAAPVAYLAAAAFKKTPWKLGRFELLLPPFKSSLLQVTIASLDWALAAAVLYALLPPWANVNFPLVLGAFLLGQIAGLVSQVPGGLGVFESCLLFLLTPRIPAPALFAALVAYRVVYYLVPLAVASAMLAVRETLAARETFRNIFTFLAQWFPVVAPRALAFLTYLAGVVLLFSGATPSVSSRIDWLEDFLPLGVLEFSHFLGSLAGLGLLILARGLHRRLDAAGVADDVAGGHHHLAKAGRLHGRELGLQRAGQADGVHAEVGKVALLHALRGAELGRGEGHVRSSWRTSSKLTPRWSSQLRAPRSSVCTPTLDSTNSTPRSRRAVTAARTSGAPKATRLSSSCGSTSMASGEGSISCQ
jgi:uncharacterized membrane protein YbhN (UPF0104 family)